MSTETETGAGTAETEPEQSSSALDINPESVLAVARKDLQDSIRSWLFWFLSAFFFILLVTLTGAIAYFDGDAILAEGATTDVLISQVFGVGSFIIPAIAIVLGWKAIVGERESGSIKILLALPHSRADVILGKLIGRSSVLSLSLIIGFVLAAIPVAVLLGTFDVTDYLGLLLISVLYGIAYTSVTIAVSSLLRSTTFAAAAAFGVFALFYVFWGAVVGVVGMLISYDYLPESDTLLEAAMFYQSLNPNAAYANALSFVTSAPNLDDESVAMLELFFDGSLPFYLQDWFAFIVLLCWIVVPIALAIYRFNRVDL
ncbi:ABC transporter permease [Natronolimnobius baerhuensis]|uniref:ABC transporter n=1 Tax=Natronolimnobius baerhuensis TaxID=253108 RepID=A0A202E4Z9_9EURY|nr:ABC transporter permease [Natronolimnobius baerhuensis]OVE83376.1 ABC transporter [Natronolimnobius baerhuensis]